MNGVDLRPRLILHPPGGAVVVLIDPSGLSTGVMMFPVLGAVPYDLQFGLPTTTVVMHLASGDVAIPVDPFSGGSGGVIDLPVFGPTSYEVVLGPPAIPADQLWGGGMANWLVPAAVVGVAFLLLRRR